jgi:pyruvate dehydrogenase phosphatase
LVGVPSYYYLYKRQQTFEIAVKSRGPDGKIDVVGHKIPLLSMDVLNSRLSANASSDSKLRPGGIRWNHTTSSLASNDPIEDAHSHVIITRDDTDPSAPGDFLFFAVMDGHGGNKTSQLLSRVLINAVFLELSNLIASYNPAGYFDRFKSALWLKPTTSAPPDADTNRVSAAIQGAFTKLDTELLNAPLRVLASNIDDGSRKKNIVPDLSKHPLALSTMLPAITGAPTLSQIGCCRI